MVNDMSADQLEVMLAENNMCGHTSMDQPTITQVLLYLLEILKIRLTESSLLSK